MLHTVAIPEHDNVSAAEPWYSRIAPSAPLPLRYPATVRMISARGEAWEKISVSIYNAQTNKPTRTQ